MNTNPQARTILCYGDSNTWGQKPDKSGRFPTNMRWTGLLQQALGNDYYIIEEGLGGRTTDLDYDRKPGRNGKTYLEPCLDSQSPLDYVVLMLGTNDLKRDFNRSAADIADALKGLVEIIKQRTEAKVILVSPILVDDNAPRFYQHYTGLYDHESVAKSERFAAEIQRIAKATGCIFVDAAKVASSGEDGLHFSQKAHQGLAEEFIAIFKKEGRMRTVHREIVGGFIFSSDGRMLLGKSKPGGVYPGHMMVPGGGVDEGETNEEAVRREVLEEVGVDITGATIQPVNDTQTGESEKVFRDTDERVLVKMHFNDFAITIAKPAAEIAIKAGDDFTDPVWVPIQELPNLQLTEPMKDTLRKLGYL